jgi:hypothetical protein
MKMSTDERGQTSTRGKAGKGRRLVACVRSSPSLAGPCTTQSEPGGVALAKARTKCPRVLFYPRSFLL